MRRVLLLLGVFSALAGAVPAFAQAATPLELLQAGTASASTQAAFDEFLKNPKLAPSGWYTPGGDSISVQQATAQMAQPGGLTGNGYTRSPTTVAPGSPTPEQGRTIRTALTRARVLAGRWPGAAAFFPSGAAGYFSTAAIAVSAPFLWQQGYYLGSILAERVGLALPNPGIPAAAVADNVVFTKRGFQAHALAAGGETLGSTAASVIATEDVIYEWQISGDSFERREFTDFSQCTSTSTGASGGTWNSDTQDCRFSNQGQLDSHYAAYALALSLANAGMGHVVESQTQTATGAGSLPRLFVWYATRTEFLAMSQTDEQEEATAAAPGDRTISYGPSIINSTTREAAADSITDTTTTTWINNQLDPANQPALQPAPTPGTTPVSGTVTIVPPPTTVPAAPALDFSPLTDIDFGCKFPYGFLCYAVDFSEQFNVAADAPTFTFDMEMDVALGEFDLGTYTVDLEVMDAWMALWRDILSVVLVVGAIYFVATRLLGFKAGGDPGAAMDDVL